MAQPASAGVSPYPPVPPAATYSAGYPAASSGGYPGSTPAYTSTVTTPAAVAQPTPGEPASHGIGR